MKPGSGKAALGRFKDFRSAVGLKLAVCSPHVWSPLTSRSALQHKENDRSFTKRSRMSIGLLLHTLCGVPSHFALRASDMPPNGKPEGRVLRGLNLGSRVRRQQGLKDGRRAQPCCRGAWAARMWRRYWRANGAIIQREQGVRGSNEKASALHNRSH